MEKQRIGHSDLKDILPIIGNKQFNNMDGKVLRFYARLNDQNEILRKFIILVI